MRIQREGGRLHTRQRLRGPAACPFISASPLHARVGGNACLLWEPPGCGASLGWPREGIRMSSPEVAQPGREPAVQPGLPASRASGQSWSPYCLPTRDVQLSRRRPQPPCINRWLSMALGGACHHACYVQGLTCCPSFQTQETSCHNNRGYL